MTPEQAIETLRGRGCVVHGANVPECPVCASVSEAVRVLADALAERDAELRESDRMVESAWRQRADETEKAKQAERERDAVVAELGEAQDRFREAEAERDKLRAALERIVDFPINEDLSGAFHFAEVRYIARAALGSASHSEPVDRPEDEPVAPPVSEAEPAKERQHD